MFRELNSHSSDSTTNRALTGGYYSDSAAMTDESCIAYCSANNFGIAATEYSQECCKLLIPLSRWGFPIDNLAELVRILQIAAMPSRAILWRSQRGTVIWHAVAIPRKRAEVLTD